jgi:hypothetical protein
MVSTVQQKKTTTYTTYKIESKQCSSTDGLAGGDLCEAERPGSRLKQNIDELDNLLSDLHKAESNHVSKSSAAVDNDTVTRKTVNHYNYQKSTTTSGGGISGGGISGSHDHFPSPLNARRNAESPGPAAAVKPSPGSARKNNPSPGILLTSSSSYNYNLRQSSSTNGLEPELPAPRTPGPEARSSGPTFRSPSPYGQPGDTFRSSSPSLSAPRTPRTGTPTGVSYYSKYHSTHTHQSQKESSGPVAFPTLASSQQHGSQTLQTPPKRVDELMSELADFDPSIQVPML